MKRILPILLLILMCGVVYFYRTWDGQTRITLIKLGSPTLIESFDPKTEEGIRLSLPDNLEIETLGDRGNFLIKSLPVAATKFGNKWAADSLADYFGIFYASNLTWVDKLVWHYWARKVQWKNIDLEDTNFLTVHVSPDGLKLYSLNSAWDVQAQKWFVSQKVASENLQIEVVNTVDKLGWGTHMARFFDNLGFKVSRVRSQEPTISGCKIMGDKTLKSSFGVQIALKFWSCVWEDSSDSGHDLVVFFGRI